MPEDVPAGDNTFICILAHPSREEAKGAAFLNFSPVDFCGREGGQAFLWDAHLSIVCIRFPPALTPETVPGAFLIPLGRCFEVSGAGGEMLTDDIFI